MTLSLRFGSGQAENASDEGRLGVSIRIAVVRMATRQHPLERGIFRGNIRVRAEVVAEREALDPCS